MEAGQNISTQLQNGRPGENLNKAPAGNMQTAQHSFMLDAGTIHKAQHTSSKHGVWVMNLPQKLGSWVIHPNTAPEGTTYTAQHSSSKNVGWVKHLNTASAKIKAG
jgi:hypothetical protein